MCPAESGFDCFFWWGRWFWLVLSSPRLVLTGFWWFLARLEGGGGGVVSPGFGTNYACFFVVFAWRLEHPRRIHPRTSEFKSADKRAKAVSARGGQRRRGICRLGQAPAWQLPNEPDPPSEWTSIACSAPHAGSPPSKPRVTNDTCMWEGATSMHTSGAGVSASLLCLALCALMCHLRSGCEPLCFHT